MDYRVLIESVSSISLTRLLANL